MESEKVKMIKKVLEQNTNTCLLYDFGKNHDCKVFCCNHILDYINELEKEIEENAFYSKGYAQGIKNTYEVVVPDKLKQFANRLKEISCEMYLKEQLHRCIDEILKEFLWMHQLAKI